ncbi:MAG: hypothetical protein AB7F43_09630 [Bacteriovoracia bacterium]
MTRLTKIALAVMFLTVGGFAMEANRSESSTAKAKVSVGPSAGIVASGDSVVGIGALIDGAFGIPSVPGLYVGLGTGYMRWSDSYSSGAVSSSGSVSLIPLVPEVVYQFGQNAVKPYIGGGMGLGILNYSASVSYGARTYSGSTSKAVFNMFVRPGIELGNLYVEPRLAVVDSDFVVLPTAGLVFQM